MPSIFTSYLDLMEIPIKGDIEKSVKEYIQKK